jgi:type IV pilus assembly protein PilA
VGDRTSEDGFSLIELMTVVLVMAVLLAIAIPNLLGAQNRAGDRAAQANVHHAVAAEHIVFTDSEAFSTSNAVLRAAEPRLIYVSGVPAKNSAEVYVGTSATGDTVVVGVQSLSGKCFWARVPTANQMRWSTRTDCSAPPAVDDARFTLPDPPS